MDGAGAAAACAGEPAGPGRASRCCLSGLRRICVGPSNLSEGAQGHNVSELLGRDGSGPAMHLWKGFQGSPQ